MLEQTIGKRERVATADDTTIVVDSSNKLEVSPSSYQQLVVPPPPSPLETAVCWEVALSDPSCQVLPTTTALTTTRLPPVTASPMYLMPSSDIPGPTTATVTTDAVRPCNPYPLPPWAYTWCQAVGDSPITPQCYYQYYDNCQ